VAMEIERKFLVRGDEWRQEAVGISYRQGYIRTQGSATVRVRVAGETGYLTLKGPSRGIVRSEFEYEIPLQDATELLDTLCDRPQIEKTRYRIRHKAHEWEIDEFEGDNAGLILAEVELSSPTEPIVLPDWVGQEVSDDPRYFNSSLAQAPFSQWSLC